MSQVEKIAFTGTINMRIEYYLEILAGQYPNAVFATLGRKGMETLGIDLLNRWNRKVVTPDWSRLEFLREEHLGERMMRKCVTKTYITVDVKETPLKLQKPKQLIFTPEVAAARFRKPWQYDLSSQWWKYEDEREMLKEIWSDTNNISMSDCDFGHNYSELYLTRNERLLENADMLMVFSEDFVSKQLAKLAESRGIPVYTR